MAFIVLRTGRRWRQPFTSRIVDVFHVVARQHGSQAMWVPSMGMVVTDDPAEPGKNLQYEEFISAAAQRVLQRHDR